MLKKIGLGMCLIGVILTGVNLTPYGPIDETLVSRPGLALSILGIIIIFWRKR